MIAGYTSMRSIPPGPMPKKNSLAGGSLVVNEPVVTRPNEKSDNAASVITPNIMLITDRGSFDTLNETTADRPPKPKAINATMPWIVVKALVKIPTPMAPMDIRMRRTVRAL